MGLDGCNGMSCLSSPNEPTFRHCFFSEMINHDAPHYQACMYQAPINDTSKAQA